jgi:hypothetical protein
MSGLEQAFYIMGIIFMSLIFIMIVVIVATVLVIRSKLNRIHDIIENKIDLVLSLAGKGSALAGINAGTKVFKEAKKVIKKAKR